MRKRYLRFLAKRLAPLACVLATCACATTTAGQTSVQEKVAMTESAQTAGDGAIDALQLNTRLLAWILSIRDAQDLSGPSIGTHTGLKVRVDPEDPDGFYATGPLNGSWRYTLSSIKPTPGQTSREVMLDFGVAGDKNVDMTPICVGPDFYQDTLAAAGFTPSQLPSRLGIERRYFKSDKARVLLHLRGRSKREDQQICVFKVVIGASFQGR